MGYVAGEKILDDEYNTFVNSSSDPFGYNHFAGTGALNYGLGQTEIAVNVAGDTITDSSVSFYKIQANIEIDIGHGTTGAYDFSQAFYDLELSQTTSNDKILRGTVDLIRTGTD